MAKAVIYTEQSKSGKKRCQSLYHYIQLLDIRKYVLDWDSTIG